MLSQYMYNIMSHVNMFVSVCVCVCACVRVHVCVCVAPTCAICMELCQEIDEFFLVP